MKKQQFDPHEFKPLCFYAGEVMAAEVFREWMADIDYRDDNRRLITAFRIAFQNRMDKLEDAEYLSVPQFVHFTMSIYMQFIDRIEAGLPVTNAELRRAIRALHAYDRY